MACRETGSEGLKRGLPEGWAVPVDIPMVAIHSTCLKKPLVVGTSANVAADGATNVSPDIRNRKAAIACRDTASEGLNKGLPVG